MSITSRVATIDVAEIRPDKPNRQLRAKHVNDLAASFGQTTFATAVVVRPLPDEEEYRWQPIAGFHRIAAAKQTGQKQVHAIVVEDASDLQLELIQIDENVLQQPLAPLQEAKAMARRKFIFQMLNPGTRRGGNRKSNAQHERKKSFAVETAAASGRSVAAVNRAAARGERIDGEVATMIQGTPLETGAFLDRLTKLPPREQKKLAADELAKPQGSRNTEPDVEGDLGRLQRCWAQSCAEARKKFLSEVTNEKAKKAAVER